jgi:hypothetical protein
MRYGEQVFKTTVRLEAVEWDATSLRIRDAFRARHETLLTAVVQEACIQGIWTRPVDDPVKAMRMTGASKCHSIRQAGKPRDRSRQLWCTSRRALSKCSEGKPRRHNQGWLPRHSFVSLDLPATSPKEKPYAYDPPRHDCNRNSRRRPSSCRANARESHDD